MNKPTPGPWFVHPDVPDQIVVDDGEGGTFIVAEARSTTRREAKADAHLIAAAPLMYEALDWIIYEIDKGTHDLSSIRRVAQEAKATAEGRKKATP